MADVFTQTGEELFADIIDGTTSAPTWAIAWGTGAGAAAKGDTTLTTEAAEDRVASTMSQPSADQNQWLSLITATGTRNIIECGIFNQVADGGIMIERSDFSAIAVVSGDKIEFTIIGTHS